MLKAEVVSVGSCRKVRFGSKLGSDLLVVFAIG